MSNVLTHARREVALLNCRKIFRQTIPIVSVYTKNPAFFCQELSLTGNIAVYQAKILKKRFYLLEPKPPIYLK